MDRYELAPVSCPLCGADCGSKYSDFVSHVKAEHDWTRPPKMSFTYWCPECGAEFKVMAVLIQHLQAHAGK
jgi:uncharacterized C2H2 Zn-finger protein